jgi:hypothetical protein
MSGQKFTQMLLTVQFPLFPVNKPRETIQIAVTWRIQCALAVSREFSLAAVVYMLASLSFF